MSKIKVDLELLEKICKNARLRLTEDEKKEFLPQLQEVINAFSVLEELDISKTKPSFQPIVIKNVWREDIINRSFSAEEALANTVHKKDYYFKGPKVVK
ncbi:MAG: Asp-tRNA(Asn)/Glu-tRNA(Gln) amidotransferase subunit GatC [Candidatus Diapherotrites archaeon]|nr:Asp-tRNA(Asn)/Glu-tRNA(Gln) amidotransferase subunit GatC [Candidatus Diapherotrites archaeon]